MWGGTALLQRWWPYLPVLILLLVWIHIHFFHLVHAAMLIFRADADCGLK